MGANDWQINGHVIFAPTAGRWIGQRPVDVQGDNRPIYSGVRAFELRWVLVSYAEWANFQVLFEAIQASGTVTARLPRFPTATGSTYGFAVYSGCTMAEPIIGAFFEEHPTDVVLLIGNIVT